MPNKVASVPVTVKLEKGVTAAGKSFAVIVLRAPEGNLEIRPTKADILHTFLTHPASGAIGAAVHAAKLEAEAKVTPGREVLSETAIGEDGAVQIAETEKPGE
jgi:hypothetical protein